MTISKLTVIGSGLMGSGISQVAALSNFKVTLVDINAAALDKARKSITSNVEKLAKKSGNTQLLQSLSNLVFSSNLSSASDSNLVIEAIIENIDAKRALFKKLDEVVPRDSILCSNTSSLPISLIPKGLDHRMERFAGLHFFNPVPVMKLVEVISTDKTSNQTTQALIDFCKKIGKTPVLCKDTPGFIVNRLLVPYMFEALRIVERGDACKEDVDTAMKLGAGYRTF